MLVRRLFACFLIKSRLNSVSTVTWLMSTKLEIVKVGFFNLRVIIMSLRRGLRISLVNDSTRRRLVLCLLD